MNILRIIHDDTGKKARLELNGVVLPIESYDVTQSISGPKKKPKVMIELDVDKVEFAIGEVESTIVDADKPPRQITAPERFVDMPMHMWETLNDD